MPRPDPKPRPKPNTNPNPHQVCVLLKDNIDTDAMHTTAGSLALLDSKPLGDAPLVTRLKQARSTLKLQS
eukprot:scaffold12738_cov81-Phaeocystis_antarctica.AAC.1